MHIAISLSLQLTLSTVNDVCVYVSTESKLSPNLVLNV